MDVGNGCAEKAKDDADDVDETDGPGGRKNPQLEVLGGLDEARLVGEEKREERAEREPHRLDDDPGYICSNIEEIAPRKSPSRSARWVR